MANRYKEGYLQLLVETCVKKIDFIGEARSVRRLETLQNEAIRRILQFPICRVDDVSMHR